MIMGAVYNPFMNELFVAEKGKGAFFNDKKIQVSKKADFKQSCLVTGFAYKWEESKNSPLDVFQRVIKDQIPIRRLGSAAIDLCWVACGRFDGFYEHHLQPWDSAAGFLIVEEAGGKVTDFDGNRYSPYKKEILASNGLIHSGLENLVNGK
ncbi:hypothetical protein HA402_012143 [Bradysia odoriphaga]|nr:hypothetical protein HA402_012143 [Bradysia odoriphaga]